MTDELDFKTKYLKYKVKYLKLKNQIGGNQSDNNQSDSYQSDNNKSNNNKSDNNQSDNKKIDVILFKSDSCGHCINFLPTWKTLQKKFVGNSKYNFITYDSKINKDKFEENNINSIPEIYLKKGKLTEYYSGGRDYKSIFDYLSV
jgi:thiol-disulfide isomerase/thioredoxin